MNRLCLTNSMTPIHGLQIHLRILALKKMCNISKTVKQIDKTQNRKCVKQYPVTIIKNASISCSKVDSQSTSPSRKKKNSAVAIFIVEVLDLFMTRRLIND